MKVLKMHKNWLIALVLAMSVVAAAVLVSQPQQRLTAAQAHDARELSIAFREAARAALPSIVSIETQGKPVKMTGGMPFNFDEDESPFGEFFKNDPRFREFFRRQQQQPDEEYRPTGRGSGFIVDAGGSVRMCDPRSTIADTDPRKC